MYTSASGLSSTRKVWNILVAFLFTFNMVFGAVPPAVAQPVMQEGLPTVTTDKEDYQPGELVTVTGASWLADTQVHLVVNDAIGQTWTYDVIVDVLEGGFTTSFTLPSTFIANYVVMATGVQSGQSAATTFTDAAALTLTKTASPIIYTAAGQVIEFSYVLKNTGSTILYGPFSVTDNKVPSVSCPVTTSLGSGASITCTGSYTITATDLAFGYVANTATASSSGSGATTSNPDVRIVSIPVDCRSDSDGANDEPGQKDLTQECVSPTAVNPALISWNWDVISMSGANSADGCALFDTDNDGLANFALCASWQNNRVMQTGYPKLYSCNDTRSDRCAGDSPLTISNGSACAVELADDDPFSGGDSSPLDAKAFCSINLADVGGAATASLIDVCSYPSVQPNSDPSDCVLITQDKGNLEVFKSVVPDDTSTNWNIGWTGPTPYSTVITGSGNTGIQAVNIGTYDISETAGTGTDSSLYDTTWACTVNGSPSTSGSGTTISGVSVAKGSVVICTFTNTRKTGTLEIKKDVVPDDASTSWQFAVTGPSALETCTINGDGTCGAKTVFSGSYNITETAGSGTDLGNYSTSYACTINGDAGPSGSGTTISGLTVNKSDAVICTFTNAQSPGTLTVNKVVVPSSDTGLFNLLIDGMEKASGVGDGGSTGAVAVSAGSHAVSETAGTDTDLNNYVTTISGDCDSSGTVSVLPNESKTCTITNTRKGTIIVEKQTSPDGQAGVFTFTGDAAGTISDNGQIIVSNLAPGIYTATEASLAADFALESISCNDGSSITPSTVDLSAKTATFKLDPGETITCTFTNKRLNPDLEVTKTADAASVTAGDGVGFSISVKNNGLGTAYNVTLNDPLPAIPGVTWAIAEQPSGGPCTLTGASLSCSFGSLAPGATVGPVNITGTSAANSCGTWNNTATAQADNNGPVTGSASVFVDCATIKIVKTAENGTVSAGDPISFTITTTNDNSGTARGVVVTDTLPTNTGLGTWTLSGTDAGACSIASGTLTCSFGEIPGHGSKTVTLTTTTTAAACGTVSNTASVTTSNDGEDSSTASVTVQCPNLSVTKTPDAATVNAGEAVGFTITVENGGPGVARGVTLTDTLPAGLSWAVTPPVAGCSIAGQNLTCSLGDLASGAEATVHVAASSTPAVCGPLTNTATAAPTNGAAATSAPATITVNCADVTVEKTGNGPLSAGDTAAFTIKVSVTGSGSLSSVTLTDPLPAGVNWAIDPAITACSISDSPQVLSCSWPTLAAGTEIEIVVSGATSAANCAAPLSNTATVSAANETDTTNNTASDSIAVNCATIQIEKTTSTPTVSAGDPVSYTITVTNPGAGIARNVTVTDSLPGGASLNWSISPAVSGCSITGGVLTCNFGDLASGGNRSVTLVSPTTAASCGVISNTASVTTTNDGNAISNPATDITILCPNLSVTKMPDAVSVSAGDTIGFTVTVNNAGPGEAKGVMISDSLPGGLAWTVDAGSTTASDCTITDGILSCGPDTLASGGSVKVYVTAVSTPASCGQLFNSATATPTNGNAATSGTAAVTVLCPDLTVAKTGNGPISAGDTATFTITVTNSGPGAGKNVSLTDTLPGGLTWAVDPADPACSITGTTTQTLSCNWPALAAGASASVSVSAVTAKENCGTLTNTVHVAADNEQNTSNNSAIADIQINCANIQIEKSTSTPTVSAGDTISYTVKVSNPGAGTAANVVVTDSLPGGLTWTIDSANSDSGCEITGSALTCAFGSIASGGSKEVTITATTTYENCGSLSNTATVTTSNDGAATSPSVEIVVLCPALQVTKTADAATVSAGDSIGFTITVTNTGAGTARDVTLSDTLPTGSGISWSINPASAGCALTDGALSCSFGDLAYGETRTVHVTSPTTANSCAIYNNTATVSADNQPSVISPEASIEVQCATIAITKTADSATVSAGDAIGFTITVTNPGPGTAYGVTVTDTLPVNAGLDWAIDPAVSGCAITDGVLTCNFGTLAAGATRSVHVSSPTTAATCGTVENTASVTTTNDGSGSAGDSVTVNCPDVKVTKWAGSETVSAGDLIIFMIEVKNIGAGIARNVTLTDTLPTTAGLDWWVSGTDYAACTITAGVVTCDFGDLAPGAAKRISLVSHTTAASCGLINNTAVVSATNEPTGQANNSSTASLRVNCPDLVVEKTGNGPINAGDTAIYTITVRNTGAGTAAGVTLSDPLPAGIVWSVDNADCAINASSLLTCAFGSLPAGESIVIHVSGTTNALTCGPLTNTVTVAAKNEADTSNNSATGSVTVNCASIGITKTAASSISAGDTLTYTITVTNSGAGTAYGVEVTDTLPTTPGLGPWTVTPGEPACAIDEGELTCALGDMPANSSQTMTLSTPTSYASCGTIFNEASVTTSNDGTAKAGTNVTVNCPALEVSKTADASTVSAGDAIGFTITVTNTGDGIAKNATLTDTLPTGSGISWSISGGTGAADCSISSGILSCSFGDLAYGETRTVHVTSLTTANGCETYKNTATVSADNQPAVISPEASITVRCAAIQITKIADEPIVSAGDTIGFTIEVRNSGLGSAYGVTVTDTLPDNAGLDWAMDPAVGGCAITDGVLTCNFGTLTAEATRSVHVSSPTTAATCGTVENTASVTTTNDGSGSAGDSVTVNCPDVKVTKWAGSETVSAGDLIIFMIQVENIGAGIARNVTLTDTLPTTAGLDWWVSGTDYAACTVTAGVVTCDFGDLAPGAVKRISLVSHTTAASCGLINNTAVVSATNEPTGQANNTSTANINVLCAAISIIKTPNASTVNAGDTVGFTITVTNEGQGTAKNITINDTLPANPGLSWSLGSLSAPYDTSGSCYLNLASPQKLACNFDQLSAGKSISLTIVSQTTLATACATIDNTASVNTSNDGSDQASASITVTCANITITKEPVSATVSAGDAAAYDIVVTNTGLSAASELVITDDLPSNAGLHWTLASLSAPADTTGSCTISADSPQKLACAFDRLAAGESVTVRISSPTTYATCGTISNTASVTTSNDGSAATPASEITVYCPALEVVKTPAEQTVSAGEPISFTITVTNNGAGVAKAITLSDQLSKGINWSVNNASCSVDENGLLTCGFGDLASGATASVTVTGETIPALCGMFDNTATVTLANGPDAVSNTVSVTVNCPDVTVTKEAVRGTVSAGDTAAFKIVVANSGAGTAYGVTLTDTLPAGINWTIDPAVTGCAIVGNTLSCSFATLAADASIEIIVSGDTNAALCGQLDNTVTVAASNEANTSNNSANASITVNCSDVTVTKTAASGTINAGDMAAFKIVVTNSGAGTAFDVTATDTLPAGITWTIDPAVTGCAIIGSTLSCSFATLEAGASLEIKVSGVTSAAVCGALNNTVTVASSNEANTSNNSASASITVNCSDVTVTKEAVIGTINAGDTAAFKIVVTNDGAGTAYNVTLTDSLPAGIAWTIDPAVTGCAITGNTLICSFATLASGASVEISVSGTTSPAVCGKLENAVTVAASNEANTSNNIATASITVNCPDITVTKEAITGTISAGDTAAFKIVVKNGGAGTAYNVSVNDTLPAGITWAIDPAVTGCAITGSTLSCSFATLAAGASIEIKVSGTTSAAVCGVLDNTVTVAASNEANTENNSASASITVNCPDVRVTKTARPGTIHYGQDAVFEILVENTGPGRAYNVALTDTLPGGLTWTIDPAVTGCAITGGTLTCEWASLNAGAGIKILVSAPTTGPSECGTIDNTVTVGASNEKAADTGNNTSSASISITCPADLTIAKTADPAFKREFFWSISKDVDKTFVRQVGGTVIFNYTVNVAETGFTDSSWIVTGKIMVTNPNDWIEVSLTGLNDTVNNGGTCAITGFSAGMKVPAGKSMTFDYTCTYAAKPDSYAGVNTATVTWDASIGTPSGSAANTANFAFDTGTTGNPTNINKTVTITDTFNGATTTLGTLTATTVEPYTTKTYSYNRTVTVPSFSCKSYTNTAKIVETGQQASQTVTVCGPMKTGALTIGYWQNKNGQALITKAGAVSGVCKLTPYLRKFAPFQDLSATASCSAVASYVSKIIKAASASGASMNVMLKAQMLATTLDVYFSDPALGGNKINAPAPIGSVVIDLTYIKAGSSYLNVSSAFGGVTSMKVMDMLMYAASKSNVGGSVWYGNVKTTQELAKDAFDAINNQWAFAP